MGALAKSLQRGKPRVGMFYYSDPDTFPPVTNPAQVLARAGYQVDIIAYYRGNHWSTDYGSGIRIIRLNQPGMDFPLSIAGKVKGLWDFVRRSARIARTEEYDVLYGHDMHGFLAAHYVGQLLKRPVIYHCHDLAQLDGVGKLDRWVKRYERCHNKEAVVTILPEARRGQLIKGQNGLLGDPIIVWNCPLRETKRSPRRRILPLAGGNGSGRKFVIRHGPLWYGGQGHCLEETIRSIPYWRNDTDFVLLGYVAEDYSRSLRSLAKQVGVEDRLHLVPPVRHGNVFDHIVGANLGHALYNHPSDINKKYQATASLKFFEYMRAGLPVIAPEEEGFTRLIDEFECGTCVDAADPDLIGNAIRELLSDESLQRRLGENAYRAHLEKCNYETQYRPVMEFLEHLYF
jgi:glycosyltransferase involved in cell wall biosynthesis